MSEYHYKWTLKDAKFTKDKGKVFSCFACGGGSTMGYKLAGFDVIGHNDIDARMIEVYKINHNPKYSYHESIVTFAKRKDLPSELYDLDILDGSPPCSSFSTAGNREKDWGKEKKFAEGQKLQVLDTLFFDFIELAKELQPKVVIAENVKGLLLGAAKEYVKKIYKEFDEAGYYCQHWLLDASKMGVPQKRERVFFICLRKDLAKNFLEQVDMFRQSPKLDLVFNQKEILFNEIFENYEDRPITGVIKKTWYLRKCTDKDMGYTSEREYNKYNYLFNNKYIYKDKVCYTILASDKNILYDYPRYMNVLELIKCGSFPEDYNFLNIKPFYLIGMSVPPLMTAKIAEQVYNQWLANL